MYRLVTLLGLLVSVSLLAKKGEPIVHKIQGEGLSHADVMKVVQAKSGDVRKCYTEAIKKERSLTGKVALELRIGPDGKVVECGVVESTIEQNSKPKPAHVNFKNCLVSACKAWPFPKPVDPVVTHVASIPFYFRAPASR